MAGGVFVSYRRDDAAHVTGRIADALAGRIGRENVFVDVDSVAPGEDFVRKIETTIRGADTFLAVIGAHWLSAATPQGQRRIDLDGDFIRLEVRSALAAGVTVIPVLVDGAVMPRAEDLPEDIRQLVRHNAVLINHATFARDVQALLDQLYPAQVKRGRSWINALALPVGAGVVMIAALALALWPRGAAGPVGLASSISLQEQERRGERLLNETAFVAERGADGRLAIRAELPYRDRMREEKRIDGLAFGTGSPLTAPSPRLMVQVTNTRAVPVSINEIQFEVVRADPDLTALPVLRERAEDYRAVTMFNEGWGEIEAPRLAVSAWGLPEADRDAARKSWKGVISVEPCASPSKLVAAPVTVEGETDDTRTEFDLAGRIPRAFDGEAFVCAVGELSFAQDGRTQRLAVRTRVSNKKPSWSVASPAIAVYDLYLDPEREAYVAIVPVKREIAAGATDTIEVRVQTDRSSSFQLRHAVRTAAGEIIPGDQLGLEIFVSRNSNLSGMLDEERRIVVPADVIAAFDRAGIVSKATYDPQQHEAAVFDVRDDLDDAACRAFIETVARPVMAKVGKPASAVRAVGPTMFSCPRD